MTSYAMKLTAKKLWQCVVSINIQVNCHGIHLTAQIYCLISMTISALKFSAKKLCQGGVFINNMQIVWSRFHSIVDHDKQLFSLVHVYSGLWPCISGFEDVFYEWNLEYTPPVLIHINPQ